MKLTLDIEPESPGFYLNQRWASVDIANLDKDTPDRLEVACGAGVGGDQITFDYRGVRVWASKLRP